MFSLLICLLIPLINGFTNFNTFNDKNFNLNTNSYPNNINNLNIIPISKENANLINNGWILSKDKYSYANKSKFILFNKKIFEKDTLCYKWVPNKDKSYVNGLINLSININKNQIIINKIIANPSISSFNKISIINDIEKLTKQKEYSNFQIILNNDNIFCDN